MKLKTSGAAQVFIDSVHDLVGARNKAVLGRSALFLAIGEGVLKQISNPRIHTALILMTKPSWERNCATLCAPR